MHSLQAYDPGSAKGASPQTGQFPGKRKSPIRLSHLDIKGFTITLFRRWRAVENLIKAKTLGRGADHLFGPLSTLENTLEFKRLNLAHSDV